MSLCAIPKVVCEQPMLGATSLINSFINCSEHLLIFFYLYFFIVDTIVHVPDFPPFAHLHPAPTS